MKLILYTLGIAGTAFNVAADALAFAAKSAATQKAPRQLTIERQVSSLYSTRRLQTEAYKNGMQPAQYYKRLVAAECKRQGVPFSPVLCIHHSGLCKEPYTW